MSTDIKLEPCPFCGSTHISLNRCISPDGQVSSMWVVECQHCSAKVYHADRDRVLARWNTRVDTFRADRLRYECLIALLQKSPTPVPPQDSPE